MTSFTELLEEKTKVPMDNFKESLVNDLKSSTDMLKSGSVTETEDLAQLKALKQGSENTLFIYNNLIEKIGLNEHTATLFIGTVQGRQSEIEELKGSKLFKETLNDYYDNINTNFYLLVSEVGSIIGDIKRSFDLDFDEPKHKHEHEEKCTCTDCHV